MKDFQKGIMRGEFRGDFTRDTFNPEKTFSRVLLQQGRVQLDADWNEQVSIHLHQLRSLACDIGGPHWGPNEGSGFAIEKIDGSKDFNFTIRSGHYYVNGILCEAGEGVTFNNQPNFPELNKPEKDRLNQQANLLVYLDIWERHITYVEDDAIREVALGGPDTASRAKIIWQVKLIPTDVIPAPGEDAIPAPGDHPFKFDYPAFLNAIGSEIKTGSGKLQARARDRSKEDTEPCLTSPAARYRGAENQLYRVEIHRKSNSQNKATFKWSRENGSVIFPILARVDSNGTSTLSLEHLGRDDRFNLKQDDWVELVDDHSILQNRAESLLQIMSIDRENQTVTLKGIPDSEIGQLIDTHPYVR
ncbi:MAG: DUF6519 domain-containing protein, partial [Methylococcales bacterium]